MLNVVLNTIRKNINDPILTLCGEDWHEGIIGIIASRIKDKFNKPTIIISIKDKVGKASARSVAGFDIGSAILAGVENKILLKGGGHKMAGGFTIDQNNIEKFKEFILKRFNKNNINNSNNEKIYLDAIISSSALNFDFYNKIDSLSPFGSGNPEPKFLLENLRTVKSLIVGEKHVKAILEAPTAM